MADDADDSALRAETRRRKAAAQSIDAAAGWAAYRAQAEADAEKSARLKALRLARDAAEKEQQLQQPAKPAAVKKKVKVRRVG
jgi:hypothetical protein